MKILRSFDTKTDSEEFVEAIKTYWEWNVILIKRHRIKLLIPLIFAFVSMVLIGVMLWVIYNLLDGYKVEFRILSCFYIYTSFSRCLWVMLWIMKNIIWQIKSPKKYIDTAVKAELKQQVFEKFLKRSFFTFSVHVLILLFNIIVSFVVVKNLWMWSLPHTIGVLAIDIIFLVILNRVMFRVIDYEMNFNICTKDSFMSYRQEWFFKTNEMDIPANSIKVIQHSKEWLLWALFLYGDIYIYTDWDLNIKWWKNLKLSYLPDPKRLTKKINMMMIDKMWRN